MVASFAIIHRADYYTRDSAAYYLSDREPKGRWLTGHTGLGVERGAEVVADRFQRLCAGLGEDGRALIANGGGKSHTAGVDLTFSCPKGVSVLWAIGNAKLRATIERAEAKAVAATVAFLERELPLGRRGHNGGRREHVKLLAAAFPHGEARPERHADGVVAPDPQRHTHVTILNVAERQDGSAGAIDTIQLRQWKKALGVHFRVGLATGLQQAGFGLGPVSEDGLFDVAGVPAEIARYFSARRATIEEELATAGVTSAAAPALAASLTRSTRRDKKMQLEGDRFERWRDAVHRLGHDPEFFVASAQALGAQAQQASAPVSDTERLAEVPDRLTRTQSAFERRHLFEAVGAALVGTAADAARIETEVARLIASGAVVELGADRSGAARYSTPQMIAVERALVDSAERLARDRRPTPTSKIVSNLADVASLTTEQRTAVELVTSGARLAIVQGTAGTGKSHTLAVVARAWETTGYQVLGASIAWKAANTLGCDLGVSSRSIDSWLASIEHGSVALGPATLLIVDEAGLLSSRQMERLLAHVETAQASVLLVGDDRQLQPIGPGSALRLVNDAIAGARLDTIVRQREAWAREAVHAFARGDAAAGLESYRARGLVTEADGVVAAVTALADTWNELRRTSPRSSRLAVAKTNSEVRALSAAIRSHLRSEGIIRGVEATTRAVTPSGQEYDLNLAVGDRIRFLRRFDELGVVNGTEVEVTRLTPSRDGSVILTVRLDQSEIRFALPEVSDDSGRSLLAHAWASTIFQAQGTTVDHALVLGSSRFDRHDAYVAFSRARQETRLFLDSRALDREIRADAAVRPATVEQAQRFAHLSRCLSRENLKHSTLDPLIRVAAVAETRARAKTLECERDLELSND